jgi:peptide chain release factor subunit 1
MAETVTWDVLRELAEFRAEKGCAISVYVNLDPSVSPTADDADTRISSLIAEGERSQGANSSHLTHEQRVGLKADFERITNYFENEFSRDGTMGVAIFLAGLDNAWRALSLSEPTPDKVRVSGEFYLAPLVPLIGRGDGAIVAVVGRERGQLFRLQNAQLVEIADQTEEAPGRHDQGGWSQSRFQRHIEKLVAEHLRDVADELDRHLRRLRTPKIVIVASDETHSELEDLLSNEVRNAVVGWTTAEAHAPPAELLQLARPLLDEARAQEEAATIERWREEAGRGGRASSGWKETLEAASDARVEVLIYQDGADHEAWQCPACGRLALEGKSCPLDGTAMEERDDGLDLAVHQTLAHGGTVWAVTSRRDLDPVEGIGALLRY